jgi:Flp pilus assembly protein TadG
MLHGTQARSDRQLLPRRISLRAILGDATGSSLVELALMVPVFTALLIGAAEFAALEFDGIEVSNAARAGVAYGSQSAATASDLSGMQAAALNDGPDVPGLNASAIQFWSCANAPSIQYTSIPTCSTGNRVLHYVQVTTSAKITPSIHLPGLPTAFNLNGLAIMRVQ